MRAQFYNEVGGAVISGVRQGMNVTMLTVGARGSGKTTTMQHPLEDVDIRNESLKLDGTCGLACQMGRDLVSYAQVAGRLDSARFSEKLKVHVKMNVLLCYQNLFCA